MTLEEAIREQYGVRIQITPADLKMRKFKIDELRNGFVIKTAKLGVFGSFIDGETFILTDSGDNFQKQEHKDNKEIRYEWLIWEIAMGMIERGERLDRTDRERLKLAVTRLEAML